MLNFSFLFRVRQAKRDGAQVVDVDGSYLYRKKLSSPSSSFDPADTALPSIPLTGWDPVDESNHSEMAKKIPHVTHGKFKVQV